MPQMPDNISAYRRRKMQDACRLCPGYCCKLFFMRHSKKQMKALLTNAQEQLADGHNIEKYQEFIADIKSVLKRIRRVRYPTGPEVHPSKFRADRYAYTCIYFDEENGVCGDYEGRPSMCHKYHCNAGKGEIPTSKEFPHLAGWSKHKEAQIKKCG